jgi:4-diphosphocytidyl-2C-methyl-D-erythritol kinase
VKQTLNLLKKIAKNNRIPESSCRMSGTGGAIFCSTPTLAIAKRITSQLQANKTEKILIKICERLPFKNI